MDRSLEQPHHPRGDEGGHQVDAEPQGAPPRAAAHAGEDVFLVLEAGGGEQRVLRLLADDVEHVVDGDTAEQAAIRADDGRGQQVAALEQLHHLARRHVGRDAVDLRVHGAGDGGVLVAGEEGGDRQGAEVAVVPVHHEQAVGALRELAAHAQVAQHDPEAHVRADRDRVGVHQAAGAVLRIAQHGRQPDPVLLVHRAQDLAGDDLGQLRQQVGEVVHVEAFRGGHDLVGLHLAQQLGADFLGQLDQHVAVELAFHQFPGQFALRRRQGLEQVGDLRRVQRVDHPLRAPQGPRIQRGTQRGETRRPVVADVCRRRVHGEGPCRARWRIGASLAPREARGHRVPGVSPPAGRSGAPAPVGAVRRSGRPVSRP